MRTRIGLSVALLVVVSGCGIKDVHLAHPPMGQPIGGLESRARVVVVRPSMLGMAIGFPISINHVDVGTLHSHDYVEALVPAGPVLVSTRAETECELSFPAEAGNVYYVQAEAKMGWMIARVQLEPLEPGDGARALAKCENQTRANVVIPDHML